MKKIISSAAAVALLALGPNFGATAQAQQQQQPAATTAATSAALPHKVALIDMAFVFQNYEKFKVLREDIKKEIEQSDAEAKAKAQQLQMLQQELKQLVETGFAETSDEYAAKERALAEGAAAFEAFRKVAQREFLRKEAELYKQIYLEATDMVQKYAKYKQITLVLRFNREGVDASPNPQEILQRMNKQVVYHQPQDDITDDVVKYLNSQYKSASGGAAPAGAATR